MDREQTTTPLTERKLVRRGLIAGLAGLGAAAMMQVKGAGRALAADLVLGSLANESAAQTRLTSNPPFGGPVLQVTQGPDINNATSCITATMSSSAVPAIRAFNSVAGGIGINGRAGAATGAGAGVEGFAVSGAGVIGRVGVFIADPSTAGVEGQASGGAAIAVKGTHVTSGTGVMGLSNSGGNFSPEGNGAGIGVLGKSGSGAGVRGESGTGAGVSGGSPGAVGVAGFSDTGVAMRGISSSFVGVVGVSTQSIGLWANTSASGVPALFAENVSGGNRIAAQFNGNVIINGALTLSGAKAAVVAMPDGTQAMMYCQEAPEPFFEDFGRAQMVGGAAQVLLDPEFASLVHLANYMVFITPGGDSRGSLYVSRQDARGFEVRETQGGTSSLPFAYRVVAKRKDIPGRRLERIDPQVARNVAALQAVAATRVFGPEVAVPGASGPGSGGGPGGVTVPFTPAPIVPAPTIPSPVAPAPTAPNPVVPGPVVPGGSGPTAPSGGGPGAR